MKSNADVEVLCVFIFWMDGELKRLTLWIMVLDELKKEAKRFFSIASPLRVTVNKEVEDPVVAHALWFIGEFGKSHHLGIHIKGVGYPDESCWANVGFRQRDSRNRNKISNEALLFWKNGKAKRGAPVLSCDFLERKPVYLFLLSRSALFPQKKAEHCFSNPFSSTPKHALSKQRKLGLTIHTPFDAFQPIYLTF